MQRLPLHCLGLRMTSMLSQYSRWDFSHFFNSSSLVLFHLMIYIIFKLQPQRPLLFNYESASVFCNSLTCFKSLSSGRSYKLCLRGGVYPFVERSWQISQNNTVIKKGFSYYYLLSELSKCTAGKCVHFSLVVFQ